MAFTAVGNFVVGLVSGFTTISAAFAAGAYGVAALGALGAIGAAYVTSRVINGNPNKGNNSARNEGGRIQVAPATNNKIPVIYGNAYVNGAITDARLTTLDQKDNNVMFYCIVLGETTNNINTTYGLESVYWNDLRLTALSSTSTESHVVKDGRKVVNINNDPPTVAGSFVVGKTYVITKLGTTTQAQWNTIAGTTGRTYGVGSVFEAATTGASSGNGQAQEEDFIDTNFIVDTNQYVQMRVYAGGSTAADQIFPTNSNNKANAYNFWGSTPQNPNGDGSWTSANEMKGLIFAIVKLRYSGEKGFTALPNVTFQIANNVTNPADVWYDYMTSERYGAGIDPSYIDTAAQTAWYNYCEEDISYTSVNLDPQGGAGTTNQLTSRYSINGVIDTSNQVKTNIDTILQNGGAWMSYNVDTGLWSPIIKKAVSAGIEGDTATYFTASRNSGNTLTVSAFPSGRIEVGQLLYDSTNTLIGTITAQLAPTGSETAGQIGRYTTSTSGSISSTTFYTLPASVLEFNDDNIISGISISSTRLEDLYNQVEVEFYNKYNKDQKAYFRNNLDQADRNPNEPDNQLRMSLDLCNNSPQADMIGQMELRQSRDDLVIEFTSTHYGIQAQGGDVIAVTSELYGWYPKYFRVMRVKEIEGDDGSLVANIQALEYNPDAYTIEPITEFSTAANIGIGVYGSSPNLPLPPSVVIASVDADAPIPNFELQVTVPASGGPFDEIELYYTEGWDQHPVTGSIVPGTGSNGAAVGQGLLTITATTYGNINPGDRIDLSAPAQDIYIVSQLTNSPASKTFVSGGVPASSTSTLLTLNNVTGLIVGNTLTGTGIPNGSFITEIDAGTNTVRIEDAVSVQAAGTYTVSGGLGTYVVDTSTTISGTADLYDFPEADNYKILKKIVPTGNDPTFANSEIIRDVVTNVPANSATYRRWFVKARMGIKKQFGEFSVPGATDFETGRFPYSPNPTAAGALSDLTDVDITNPNEGQTLYYDATTSKWINNSILEVDDTATFGGIVVGQGITQPMITFPTQTDGSNGMYGIRGMSTQDDPWFVGGGSTGNDQGYLEIATGDNAGGDNSGGQIYVRQYNGTGGGVPWYNGSGTVEHELILLDNLGNTSIPNNLTVNSGVLFVDATNNRVGINNGSPNFPLDVSGNVYVNGDYRQTLNNLYLSIDDAARDSTLHLNSGKNLKWDHLDSRFEFNDDLYVNDNLTVAGSTYLGNNYIVDQTDVVGQFKVTNNSIDNLFVDRNTGYVGINDNTPSYNLDVNGTANVETTLTVPSITTLTGDDLSITAFSGRNINITATNSADNGGLTLAATTTADPVTIVRNSATTDDSIRTLTLRANNTTTGPVIGFGNFLEFETETTPGTFARSGGINNESTGDNAGVLDEFKMTFSVMSGGTNTERMVMDHLGNLQIDNNLSIKGTNLVLNSDGTGTEDITITFERGADDAVIKWNESTDRFEFNKPITTEINNGIRVSQDLFGTGYHGAVIAGTTGTIFTGGDFTFQRNGGTYASNNASITVDRAGGATDSYITWNESTDTWDISNDVTIADDLTVTGDITINGTINGLNTITGDLMINGDVGYQNDRVRFETYNFNAATGAPTQVGIDLFAKATYRSARYSITMTQGSAYQMVNISIIHDGTTAYMSVSDDIATGANIATFDLTVDATHVVLYATVNGTVNFKWYRWLTETN